jgi:hypothetical protein
MSLNRRSFTARATACAVLPAVAACATPPADASWLWLPWIEQAKALRAVLPTPAAQAFLDEVARLPAVAPRTLYRHEQRRTWLSAAEWQALPEADRAQHRPREFDAMAWASTFYGSPLAYALLLDVAAAHGLQGLPGRKIIDYGYGAIGAPRLLAQAGAQVIGLDVDPVLGLLYNQPGDTGRMRGGGSLQLLNANFPGDGSAAAVGRGAQLFISKNTLKNGYLRPEAGNALVRPPVPLPEYLAAVRHTLAAGGLFVIYNLSLKQDPAQYRPANDGRCPFTVDELNAAGFEVLRLDSDHSAVARRAGEVLGWAAPPAQGGMGDLQSNLFALATVAQAR